MVPAGVHSGAGFKPILSGGTNPPPKLATLVNVCPLPPRLVTRTFFPLRTVKCEGSFRHEGCPMRDPPGGIVNGETSSIPNSAAGTSPW